MDGGEAHSFTTHGNTRDATRKEIVKWILETWANLDSAAIVTSFKSCGLTVALDGSEDDRIHCFKKNQPCHSGLARIKAVQPATTQSRESDHFDGITDSDVEDAAPDMLLTKVTVTMNLSLIENKLQAKQNLYSLY